MASTCSIYKPLDSDKHEVRFMRLDHDPDDNPINCYLETLSLDDKPEFMALSYCWTKEPASFRIRLNGQLFFCRPNLYNYLTLCKAERLSRLIFIDAICINQDDLAERESQIRLMRRIYSGAVEVVAWLGLPHEKDVMGQHFWNHLHDLRGRRDQHGATFSREKYERLIEDMDPYSLFKPDQTFEDRARTALGWSFLKPDFFSRVWIMQELLLARVLTFRCGIVQLSSRCFSKYLPPFEDFFLDGLIMTKHDDDAMTAYWASAILAERDRMHDGGSEHMVTIPFHRILHLTNSQNSTHPLDMIFGILGVSESSIFPRYMMSKLELFTRALIDCGTLMLKIPNPHAAAEEDFASWGASLMEHYEKPCLSLLFGLKLDPSHPTVALVVLQTMRGFLAITVPGHTKGKEMLMYKDILKLWAKYRPRTKFQRLLDGLSRFLMIRSTRMSSIHGRSRSRPSHSLLADPEAVNRVMSRNAWIEWIRVISIDQLTKRIKSPYDPGCAREVLARLESSRE